MKTIKIKIEVSDEEFEMLEILEQEEEINPNTRYSEKIDILDSLFYKGLIHKIDDDWEGLSYSSKFYLSELEIN